MLTRELYNNLIERHNKNKEGISVSFHKEGDPDFFDSFTGLACYNSYLSYKKIEAPSATHTIITPYYQKAVRFNPFSVVGHAFFFADDSPWLGLSKIIYDYSYKDWCTWEEFKLLFLNGWVIEHSLIDEWCPASLMGMMMFHRDHQNNPFNSTSIPDYATLRKKLLLDKDGGVSAYFFPNGAGQTLLETVPELLDTAEVLPVKTIFERKDFPNLDDGTPVLHFLTESVKNESSWANYLDMVSYLFSGIWGNSAPSPRIRALSTQIQKDISKEVSKLPYREQYIFNTLARRKELYRENYNKDNTIFDELFTRKAA